MNGFSTSSRHEVRIYEADRLDLHATWRWFINDPSSVAQYSHRLAALIERDRHTPSYPPRSRVSPVGGVTENALRSIIGVIPGSLAKPTMGRLHL